MSVINRAYITVISCLASAYTQRTCIEVIKKISNIIMPAVLIENERNCRKMFIFMSRLTPDGASMDEAEKLARQGFQLLSEGDYAQALSKFEKAIKLDPRNAEAYFGKAEAGLCVSKMSVEEILESYKKAIELDPQNAYFHASMGSFCLDVGKLNEAESAYNKAAEIDPDNAPYYYSEFAVEYYRKAPEVYEKFMDDKTMEIILKKALKYLLKSINLDEEKAKKLLA
ncbi:MAG: tetratricopeptide repeat protein [Methanomassiliicoccales archaeon]|nr:tetratricopeptide repeat protein [Methanomassiliicoccales archaeon]